MSDQGVQDRPDLIAAGWVRRYLADGPRAEEARKTYKAAGFEVRLEKLTPTDLGQKCQTCAATACSAFVIVYTRRITHDPGL